MAGKNNKNKQIKGKELEEVSAEVKEGEKKESKVEKISKENVADTLSTDKQEQDSGVTAQKETPNNDNTVNDSANTAEEEIKEKKEEVGEATFQKKVQSQVPVIITVIGVVVLALILFAQTDVGKNIFPFFSRQDPTDTPGQELRYVNPIHGYAYTYPNGMQLVAAGHIPIELNENNIYTMEDLRLTDSDSILAIDNPEGEGSVVYTVLELSTRENYTTFDVYLDALFTSLDEPKEFMGIEYTVSESTVSDDISSTEIFFKVEVPIDETGETTRTGVFYDNIFEVDSKAYSFSFSYPEDIGNADKYMVIYRDLLASFEYGVEVDATE